MRQWWNGSTALPMLQLAKGKTLLGANAIVAVSDIKDSEKECNDEMGAEHVHSRIRAVVRYR